MAEELDDQAAMAQWAAENGPAAMPPAAASIADADPDAWAPPTDGESTNERILNQEEIDSLLGFDLSGDDGGERTGIRAIINSALVSYERLPMLEIVFDRLVRLM
ncbi:MAG: fliM, partial [Devosia sp.]|nr:fliM [Devosia sp.]